MADKNKKVKYWHSGVQHWQIINIFLVIYDVIAITFSYFFALWIRFDCSYSHIDENYLKAYIHFIPIYISKKDDRVLEAVWKVQCSLHCCCRKYAFFEAESVWG